MGVNHSSSEVKPVRYGDIESQESTTYEIDSINGLTRLIAAESEKSADVKKDGYDFTKESIQALKQLFKKMDPTVTQTSADAVRGEIQLSFRYKALQQLLLVKVIRCKDLNPKDLRGKDADPYVRVYLHGKETGQQVPCTQVCRKTLNPVYHEIVTFPMTDEQLNMEKMIIQVWDKDIMDRDDFIGEVVIPLKNIDFTHQPVYTAWYNLQAQTNLHLTGDLEVSVRFDGPSSLQVTVHKANNISDLFPDRKPNPFLKIQVPGTKHLHHTQILNETLNPVWEETFTFKMKQEELADRCIILHLVDYDAADNNESLGQVIIDLSHFDPENGLHDTFPLADLSNNDRMRARWFQPATVQEFREAMMAHAQFKQPLFLFQQGNSAKVIKVSSRKAGAKAKLHIINGIPVY